MIYKIGNKLAIYTFWSAICSITLFSIFILLMIAGVREDKGCFLLAILLGGPVCLISFILMIVSFFNKELFSKCFKKIFISFVLSFISPAYFTGITVYAFYLIFHEEPYNENHTPAIINYIESNFDFNFPEKIESLQAGDTIAAGIDHDYVCIVRFITDHNGFSEMKKYGEWQEVTEDIEKGEWVDPRYFTSRTPVWFKKEIKKGRTYEGYIDDKNPLHVICVEGANNDVIVYVNGWCRWQLLPEKMKKTLK